MRRSESLRLEYKIKYGSDAEGLHVAKLLLRDPFIDSGSNPGMRHLAVYKLFGTEKVSALCRMIEANVAENSGIQTADETADDASASEHSSHFYLLVDKSAEARAVGSFRVCDCSKGISESENFFLHTHCNVRPLLGELQLEEQRKSIWDLSWISIRPEYRDGISAAWLYHAAIKDTLCQGVQIWISNINRDEKRRLDAIGIPFRRIEGTKMVRQERLDGKGEIEVGFYSARVCEVLLSVERRIAYLKRRGGMAERLALVAHATTSGSLTY